MAYATVSRPVGGSLIQKLAELRAALADRIARAQVYRNTITELAMLSDRDLADLGIARSDIRDLAFEAAWGK